MYDGTYARTRCSAKPLRAGSSHAGPATPFPCRGLGRTELSRSGQRWRGSGQLGRQALAPPQGWVRHRRSNCLVLRSVGEARSRRRVSKCCGLSRPALATCGSVSQRARAFGELSPWRTRVVVVLTGLHAAPAAAPAAPPSYAAVSNGAKWPYLRLRVGERARRVRVSPASQARQASETRQDPPGLPEPRQLQSSHPLASSAEESRRCGGDPETVLSIRSRGRKRAVRPRLAALRPPPRLAPATPPWQSCLSLQGSHTARPPDAPPRPQLLILGRPAVRVPTPPQPYLSTSTALNSPLGERLPSRLSSFQISAAKAPPDAALKPFDQK